MKLTRGFQGWPIHSRAGPPGWGNRPSCANRATSLWRHVLRSLETALKSKDAAAVAKALSHPLRLEILEAVREKAPVSPTGFHKSSGEALGNVAYHFKVLLQLGVIESAGEVPRRGAVEHLYAPATGRRWKAIREMLDVLADV